MWLLLHRDPGKQQRFKARKSGEACSGDGIPATLSVLPYQQDFIEFCLSQDVLKFGKKDAFQLKSGRQSPYFFNAGEIVL